MPLIQPFNRGSTRVRSDRTSWWHLTKWLQYWWSLATVANINVTIEQLFNLTEVKTKVLTKAKTLVNQLDAKLGQVVTKLRLDLVNFVDLDVNQDWQGDFSLDPDGDFSHGEYSDDFSDDSNNSDHLGNHPDDYGVELERIHDLSSDLSFDLSSPSQDEVIYRRTPVPVKKIFTVGSGRVELNRAYSAPEVNYLSLNHNDSVKLLPAKLGRSFSTSLISGSN